MSMTLEHEQRVDILKSYNDLRNVLQTVNECNDIWISDVAKLERLEYLLSSIFNFEPQKNENGCRVHYMDYILGEDKA